MQAEPGHRAWSFVQDRPTENGPASYESPVPPPPNVDSTSARMSTNGSLDHRPPVRPALDTDTLMEGACGGCWCMLWRLPRGGKLWQERKGGKNRRDFKRLVTSGKVFGVLAFADDEAVGWCCVGPKDDFPRLLNSRVLKADSAPQTWSITCFYIPSRWRNCGVATAMLDEAVKVANANGAAAVEGYPVRPYSEKQMPGAFAWTGVPRLFEKAEFINVSLPGASRDIYRKTLRGGRPRKLTVKI